MRKRFIRVLLSLFNVSIHKTYLEIMQLEKIYKALNESKEGIDNLQKNSHFLDVLAKAANLISSTISNDSKIFSCGNGGSVDAMHFAETFR